MIPVLLPSSGVSAGRLDVAVGQRTDPDVSPCRRDDKGADALQLFGITDDVAVGGRIDKTFAAPVALISRRIIGDITETRGPGRLDGIGGRRARARLTARRLSDRSRALHPQYTNTNIIKIDFIARL
jgi:hypothetical protein